MKSSRQTIFIGILSALGMALGLAGRVRADVTTLKLATLTPEGTPWHEALADLALQVKERTNGELQLKLFPSGIQGDEKVVIEKMEAGQLQAAALTGQGLGTILGEARLLELPFQYDNYAEVDCVRERMDERLRKDFEARGYVLLNWSELGTVYLFSRKPLRTIEDLKASKPWVWEGDPLAREVFHAFGVSPTPLSIQEVIQSLKTGLVDTVYNAPEGLIGLSWHTAVKYRVDVPLAIASAGTVIRKEVFDRLSERQRAVLREVSAGIQGKLIAESRRANEKALRTLEEKGVTTLSWPEGERTRYHEAGCVVADSLAGDGEGKLFSRSLLEEVRRYQIQCLHSEASACQSSADTVKGSAP